MKGTKRQTDTFETVLERIERMIECMEPDKPVRLSDITGRFRSQSGDIRMATVMLMKKYGITYLED